jgi:hypothetical protein
VGPCAALRSSLTGSFFFEAVEAIARSCTPRDPYQTYSTEVVSVLEDEPRRVSLQRVLLGRARHRCALRSKALSDRTGTRELRPFPAHARRIHLGIALACYVRRRTQRRGDLGLDGRAPAQRVRAIRA